MAAAQARGRGFTACPAVAATVAMMIVLPSSGDDDRLRDKPDEASPQAWEAAADLEGLRRADPEAHRILAEGTYVTFTLEERMAFFDRIVLDSPGGLEGPEREEFEAMQRKRLESTRAIRRTIEAISPSLLRRWEESMKRSELRHLRDHERFLRMRTEVVEGDYEAPAVHMRELMRRLERLTDEAPDTEAYRDLPPIGDLPA